MTYRLPETVALCALAVAYVIGYASEGFFFESLLNQGGSAVLLSLVFLYIAAADPGTWNVDSRRSFVRPALVMTS